MHQFSDPVFLGDSAIIGEGGQVRYYKSDKDGTREVPSNGLTHTIEGVQREMASKEPSTLGLMVYGAIGAIGALAYMVCNLIFRGRP